MTSSDAFPPPLPVQARQYAYAHPAVHADLGDRAAEIILQEQGTCLIRSVAETPDALYLSIRHGKNINDYEVTPRAGNQSSPFSYAIGADSFASIDDLLESALKGKFMDRKERLFCHTVMEKEYDSKGAERPLGHWSKVSLRPRCAIVQGVVDEKKGTVPCCLLALSPQNSKALKRQDLEDLIQLKHENLLPLTDYACHESSLILLRFASFEVTLGRYLQKNEASTFRRVDWITQAASAVSYLIDKGINRILLTGETVVLENEDSRQLRLIHVGVDTEKEHWRWNAPEIVLSLSPHRYPSSLAWSLGIFIWGVYTNFQRLPFHKQPDMAAMAYAIGVMGVAKSETCPLIYLPHSISAAQLVTPRLKLAYADYPSYKNYPQAPASIRELFSNLLIWSPPENRSAWSTIRRITTAERRICGITNILDTKIF